jgi:hypothetical protein
VAHIEFDAGGWIWNCENFPSFSDISEENREIYSAPLRFLDFCPKFANFWQPAGKVGNFPLNLKFD